MREVGRTDAATKGGKELSVEMLAVILVFAIPLVAVMGGVLIAIIKVLKRDRSAGSKRLNEEEARMMQEVYQGLEKMEQRIEALETILIDRTRKDEK